MRIGVIGLGSIGRRHVGNLLSLGCDIYGWDVSEEARGRAKSEYPAIELFDEQVQGRDPIDAVVIATPYDQHLERVDLMVRMGMPFFVEKPLGSLEQLPRWRELAAMDLPINQVGYQCRFHPKAQAMKLLFPNATHGIFDCVVDMTTWPGVYGPLWLEASHEIDMALWLGAQPSVSWADGTSAVLSGWSVHIRQRPNTYRRLWSIGSDEGDDGATVEFRSPEALGAEMYRAEMAHFLECVREQKPTSVPLADGLRVLEVVAQIEAVCQS